MPAELSAPATCGPARESTPTSIHEKPAALTWRRTFVDPDLESIFSEREARASLLPLTARTCWTISMLYLVVVMQQIFEGWPRWSIVTLLATSALYFSVSLVLGRIQAARVLWVRKWMLQVLMVTLLNCSCLVGPLVFVPSRLHALGITSLPMPPEQFATTATDYALKVASSLVASACFAPLDMVPLAVHVFTMIGWFATLETLNGITRHAQIAEIALLLAIGLMAIYFRGEMRGSERQNYHFRANVHAMVMLVREADARELTHKLQAESAVKLTQARSRLIRVVMHDLRSPMLTISNAAHNLDDELSALAAERALPDQQLAAMRSCTHALSTCSHICGNIVRDMLDFERIDSGRLIIVNRPFAVEELLDSTRAAFAALAAQQGISLQIEPLPSWLKGARWRGDVHRLQQCVYNALSNALKFTPAGHAVTVRVLSSAQLTQGARHGDEGAEGSRGGARCEGDDDGVRRVQSVGNMVSRMLQSISPRTRARLPGRARGGRAPPPYAASEADSDVSASRSPASALSAPPGFTLAPKYPTSASSRSARSSTPSVGASFAFGVEVVDEGCGLSPTELELLNSGDVFAQVGLGQLQGSGGSGLGLSIARQLAELHHGSEVELSSEGLGHGTRFLLRVRCAEDAPLTNERELDEEQSGARSDDVPPAAELQPPPAESPGAQPPHTNGASLCVPAEQDGAACAAPSPAAFASSSGGDAACAEHKPRRSGRTSLEPAEPIATDTDMPHSRAAEHVDSRPPPPSAPSKPARALPADFHVLHVEVRRERARARARVARARRRAHTRSACPSPAGRAGRRTSGCCTACCTCG